MNVHLALVVSGAAAVEVAVANGRFERRSGPKIERLGRLNVIVSVEKDGGLAGSIEGFGVDERMEMGGNNFDGGEPGRAEVIRDPLGGAFDIGLVFAFGADTRYP